MSTVIAYISWEHAAFVGFSSLPPSSRCLIRVNGSTPGYGFFPAENTSHIVTPKDHCNINILSYRYHWILKRYPPHQFSQWRCHHGGSPLPSTSLGVWSESLPHCPGDQSVWSSSWHRCPLTDQSLLPSAQSSRQSFMGKEVIYVTYMMSFKTSHAVPSSHVSVNKLLCCQVWHSLSNLQTHWEEFALNSCNLKDIETNTTSL